MVIPPILLIIGSLKYFDLIYVVKDDGLNNSTELMATYMYQETSTNFNMGYESSISFSMFIIAFMITLVIIALNNKRKREAQMTFIQRLGQLPLYVLATLTLNVTDFQFPTMGNISLKS